MQKKLNNQEVDWYQFTHSFLSLARIGLEELKGQKYVQKPLSFEYLSSYTNKHLLIAVLYNIKNAIELGIKFLGITVDKEYLKSHNLQELQSFLEQKIGNNFPNLTRSDKINELAKLAAKYYKLEFWNKRRMVQGSILDAKNDIFRFPDNAANFNFDTTILRKVSEEEVGELSEDIEKLKRLIGIIAQKMGEGKIQE